MSARTRIAAGSLMLAGLALIAAPVAAQAHSGSLFTWGGIDDEAVGVFVTVSQTDASLAALPAKHSWPNDVAGMEICDERGWAVNVADKEAAAVVAWNHDTGEMGAGVEFTASADDYPDTVEVDVVDVWSADSLTDCAALAYVFAYAVDENDGVASVITLSLVDPATGATVPVAFLDELDDEEEPIDWAGIATDPITGTTYLFAAYLGSPYVATADLGTGAVSALQPMTSLIDHFDSDGFPLEADFQPDGVLWLTYGVNRLEQYMLISYAAGADLTAAAPVVHGSIPYMSDLYFEGNTALAYDPYVPRLADTGSSVPAVAIAASGILLLAAGGAVAFGSRVRRTS